jgi:thiol:disulfide interchange protein
MRLRLSSLMLLLWGCSLGSPSAQTVQPVDLETQPNVNLALIVEQTTFDFEELDFEAGLLIGLEVQVDEGWYFSWKSLEKAEGMPSITWHLPEGFRIETLPQPKPKPYRYLGLKSYGYTGKVLFLYRLYPPMEMEMDLEKGVERTLSADVEWLLCSNVCIPGSERLDLSLVFQKGAGAGAGVATVPTEVNLPVAEEMKRLEQSLLAKADRLNFEEQILNWGLAGWLFLAFLGGLFLNLMPCVLPVLSIKLVALIQSAESSSFKRMQSGVCYTLGSVIAFIFLAVVLFTLRGLGESVGWGFQLQNPFFLVFLATLFFVIALNLFGVFELGMSLVALGAGAKSSASASGSESGSDLGAGTSFATGILVAVVGAPCIGPFLGAVSGLALQLDVITGSLIFALLGLGLAFPFLIIALFPRTIQWLPKPGAWMLNFKRFMGGLMLLSTGFLVWVVAQTAGLNGLIYLGVLFAGLYVSAMILGHYQSLTQPKAIRVATLCFVMLSFALGVFLAGQAITRYYDLSQKDRFELLAKDDFWQPWTPKRVESALLARRPVFIDFTADWCLICQANKVFVLNTKKTKALFESYNVLPLVADWTLKDAAISEALEGYGRSGVPLYVLLTPNGTVTILPQNLSHSLLKQQFEKGLLP